MLVCQKCGGYFIEDEDGSYYEDNNLVERYICSCSKCGQCYTYESVKPIVKPTIRNFKEL
jgi:hypothetical protein